jgi:regulatory protein
MPRIVRITQQKRHSNRYNCFLDNEDRISVTDDMILKFQLTAGMSLDDREIARIKDAADAVFTREKALELLSLREHSARELSRKLLQKGYRKIHIDKVIGDLRRKHYLDDARFATLYARELCELKRLGPQQVREKLYSRGVSPDIIGEILENYTPEQQLENCRYHYEKKALRLHDDDAKKAADKMIRYLQGKGFYWESISQLIGQLKDTP